MIKGAFSSPKNQLLADVFSLILIPLNFDHHNLIFVCKNDLKLDESRSLEVVDAKNIDQGNVEQSG